MVIDLIGKKVEVLNGKGFIQLIDYMPHPETYVSGDLAIVNAARTSFLGESKGDVADKKLLFYLYKNQHMTPFEMVQFKFLVHAPVVTWWQWVRHRTMSFNFQSGRYTEFKEDDFYIPDVWRKQSKSNKQGSSDEVFYNDDYSERLRSYTDLGFNIYSELINNGCAKEQARFFLPAWVTMYTAVVSVDARNLIHFLKLRMDKHAQEEIRVYADVIYNEYFKLLLEWTSEAIETYDSK